MEASYLNVYDRVTAEIIADLEQGVMPWQRPWVGGAGPVTRPRRHTGEPYNGANVLLLWMRACKQGYRNPTWMTFKQAIEYGANVRKGEKSAYVVYASSASKTETDARTGEDIERQISFLRGYHVFNVEQIDGLPEKFLPKPEPQPSALPAVGRLENVDHYIKNTGAEVRHGGCEAYYVENSDYIQMPFIDAFKDAESYYATLAHETTHWTAHNSRLDRKFGSVVYGDEGYAKEELVAEIGSAFLCADLGITPEVREDHAAYIADWLEALKNDKKLIFTASAHASRAVEFLKSKQPNITADIKQEEKTVTDYQTLYVSPPMQVSNHLWRLRIERSGRAMFTVYEFQDESGSFWKRSQDWPEYDTNDTYSGLPRGLSNLYRREQPALVKFGLVSQPAAPKQGGLNL